MNSSGPATRSEQRLLLLRIPGGHHPHPDKIRRSNGSGWNQRGGDRPARYVRACRQKGELQNWQAVN